MTPVPTVCVITAFGSNVVDLKSSWFGACPFKTKPYKELTLSSVIIVLDSNPLGFSTIPILATEDPVTKSGFCSSFSILE